VSELVDLRSHGRYKPDVKGLACGKVAATKAQLGLTAEEFARELGRLLSWEPSPEIVRSWEGAAAAPPGDVLAEAGGRVHAVRRSAHRREPPSARDRNGDPVGARGRFGRLVAA